MMAGVKHTTTGSEPGRGSHCTDYARWLEHIFAAPPEARNTPAAAALETSLSAGQAVRLITRVFARCGSDLARFTDAQVADGLRLIGSAGESDWMDYLYDPGVPWMKRLACIRSMVDLYRDCFARRCPDYASDAGPETERLNSTCFMWWDLFPGSPAGTAELERAVVDHELIGVMADVLELPNDACQHSALHGLGHWQPAEPERVGVIVDGWLNRNPGMPADLAKYAREAREGQVQ